MSAEKELQKRIWIVALIIYPLIFIWQCGDLTDTGFLAFNYDNFSQALINGTLLSETIITNFLGFIWMRIFSTYEILSLKFLYIILTYFSLFFSYHIIKKFTRNTNLLLFSLFISEIVFIRCTSFMYSKDVLSWSLILASLVFLTATNYKNINLFLSGIFIIIAIFSRLPNVLLLPISLAYLILEAKKENILLFPFLKNRILYLLAGSAVGFLIFNLFLWQYSILDQFYNNFGLVKKSISADSSSYSIFTLLKIYCKESLVFFKQFVIIVASFIILSWIYKRRKLKLHNGIFFASNIIFILTCFYYYQGYTYSSKFKYLPPLLCSIPLIYGIFKTNELRNFILLILFVSFIQVLGSNTGLFLKLSYGIILLLPLSVIILKNHNTIELIKINIESKIYFSLFVIIVGGIALISRIGGVYHVTEGFGSRLLCTYSIDVNKMRGIYTTKERKKHIESLTNEIKINCAISKKIFIYGHQPLFYFLTDTKPLEGTAWLKNNLISKEQVIKKLNEEIKINNFLIVDTKEKIYGEEGDQELQKFLTRNNFRKVSESPYYVMWKK